MVNRNIVDSKLDSLSRCVVRIENRMPTSKQDYLQDIDAQDIVILNLERAVQLCVDLGAHILTTQNIRPPESMSEVFNELAKLNLIPNDLAERLRKAVSFRNLAVHEYKTIDQEKVFEIAQKSLPDFKSFGQSILKSLPT